MTFDLIMQALYLWITRYLAVASLLSIGLWIFSVYLWGKQWDRRVRDGVVFFSTIGILTFILFLRPDKTDALFWQPLTWFCFSMLLVLELLWVAYLVELTVSTLFNSYKASVRRLRDNAPSR